MKVYLKITAVLFSCFVGTAALATGWSGPSGSFTYQLSNGPFSIFRLSGHCIGGTYCGVTSAITITYSQPSGGWPYNAYTQKIVVHAHDDVGDVSKARLQLWRGSLLLGEKDVLRSGSDLEFTVNAYPRSEGDNFRLVSVREGHDAGGDETVITNITVN